MGYFFGIFAYADRNISLYQTNMSQSEFTHKLQRAARIEADETREIMIPTLDSRLFDAWEESTDGKLYLHEKAALGAALRLKRKMLARERRHHIAEKSKKRRKHKQYGI